jgi:hypothetical protein
MRSHAVTTNTFSYMKTEFLQSLPRYCKKTNKYKKGKKKLQNLNLNSILKKTIVWELAILTTSRRMHPLRDTLLLSFEPPSFNWSSATEPSCSRKKYHHSPCTVEIPPSPCSSSATEPSSHFTLSAQVNLQATQVPPPPLPQPPAQSSAIQNMTDYDIIM